MTEDPLELLRSNLQSRQPQASTASFSSGMMTDPLPAHQPTGSYRFALNAVLETLEGDYPSLSNELGEVLHSSLPLTIIGHCLTDDSNSIILFSTDDYESEIGELNLSSKNYTTLINSPDLDFNRAHPIQCLFRKIRGCERSIYFTDGVNKYRAINLDNLDQYKDSQGEWVVNKFSLTPSYTIPSIGLEAVNDTGGQLTVGSYQFAIQYLDRDLNPTNWLVLTNPIPVAASPIQNNYDNIVGGLPVTPEQVVLNTGAVRTTSKSISLNISNLDQDFYYYRLAALHSTSGGGVVSEVFLLEERPISQQTDIYTYQGADLNYHTSISLSEIIIDRPQIEVAKAHAQHDQSLWLGNLSTKAYDYSRLQRAASRIKTYCVVRKVKPGSTDISGDPKSPSTYFNGHRSFQGGEVYALGIQYLIEGKWSPVFHIPGRPLNTNPVPNQPPAQDSTPLPNSVDYNFLPPNSPRWRAESTAFPITSTRWAMGYYENSEQKYPSTKDCQGNSIWGSDFANNHLEGKPIRHHRFPDRDQIPIMENGELNILGLGFQDIVYPLLEIEGHRFVVARRDEFNKTVLDTGILARTTDKAINNWPPFQRVTQFTALTWEGEINLSAGGATSSISKDHFAYLSPKALYQRHRAKGTHFKFLGGIGLENQNTHTTTFEGSGIFNLGYAVNVRSSKLSNTPTQIGIKNRNLQGSIYLDSFSSQEPFGNFDKPLFNRSVTNSPNIVKLKDDAILLPKTFFLVQDRVYKDVYTSIHNLDYRPIVPHRYITSPSSQENLNVFGGDVVLSEFKYSNVYDFTIDFNLFPSPIINGIQNFLANFITKSGIFGEHIYGFWLESEINLGLRHGDVDQCNEIYTQQPSVELARYIGRKVLTRDPDNNNPEKYIYRDSPCQEYYGYNKDYSVLNIQRSERALPLTFNYCSNCLFEYPTEVRVSKRSFQEEVVDNYRHFLALDYTVIEGNPGPITSLFVNRDKLYGLTTRALTYIPTRPQQLRTDDAAAYLGTGERFAVPPMKITSSDNLYGGSRLPFSVCNSEAGTVYVDDTNGRVFLFQDQLQEISQKGMRKQFSQDLRLHLNEAYQQAFSKDYPLIATTSPDSVGVYTVYDPESKRVIIHKRDYKPLLPLGRSYGQLYFFERDSDWYLSRVEGDIRVSLTDPNYFENKSFTVSYSFIHQAWVSYHSYLPTYSFFSDRTFYNVYDNQIYEHHNRSANFQQFKQAYYPFIVDHVLNHAPIASKLHPSIHSYLDASSYDPQTGQWTYQPGVFFTHATFYNSQQSSGEQPIVPKLTTNPFQFHTPGTNILAERVDNAWQVSNMRDYVINRGVPLFTSDWALTQDNYYIDKIPNPQAIDPSKSLFQAERLKDFYLGVRYKYVPKNDVKFPNVKLNYRVALSQIKPQQR